MSLSFNPSPAVPQELVDASLGSMLVVFVGAGISRLVGCPSWDGFANKVIDQLVPKTIDYHEKSLIVNGISDPRKRLSIAKILADESGSTVDYKSIFDVEPRSDVYEHINRYECSFVTTNYDKLIAPEITREKPETEWRFYRLEDLLASKLDQKGTVVHLHGCVDYPKGMVLTTKDYLGHYGTKEVPEFLKYLFSTKTVLFLGYGLDETEILEYILKSSAPEERNQKRLFILQGFFNAEMSLFEKLRKYYEQSFNAELIGFPRDHEDYEQQKSIIAKWGEKLSFSAPSLFDERAAMLDELNG